MDLLRIAQTVLPITNKQIHWPKVIVEMRKPRDRKRERELNSKLEFMFLIMYWLI